MRPPDMPELDVPCVTTIDTCAVAGIAQATLQAWLSREPAVILLRKHDRGAAGPALGFLLTLRRVLQIALTAELTRLGVTRQRAGNLAALFTDQGGEKPADWRSHPDFQVRVAGHLFPSNGTVLVANMDGRFDRIVTAVLNAPYAEVIGQRKCGTLVVDLDALVTRVVVTLRLPVQQIVQAPETTSLHYAPQEPAMQGRPN
jgi:hypothetical protein